MPSLWQASICPTLNCSPPLSSPHVSPRQSTLHLNPSTCIEQQPHSLMVSSFLPLAFPSPRPLSLSQRQLLQAHTTHSPLATQPTTSNDLPNPTPQMILEGTQPCSQPQTKRYPVPTSPNHHPCLPSLASPRYATPSVLPVLMFPCQGCHYHRCLLAHISGHSKLEAAQNDKGVSKRKSRET